MSEIATKFSGDPKDLLRALAQAEARIAKLEDGLSKAGKKGKDSGREIGEGLGGAAVRGASALVTGIVGAGGVLGALNLIKREMEAILSLQHQSAQAVLGVAPSHQKVLSNMTGRTVAEKDAVIKSLGEISRSTGVQEQFIATAMADAISSSGQNIPLSTFAVRQAAQILAHEPTAIGKFSGSLLDLSRITGSPAAATGLLAFVGSKSRVVAQQQQAKNIPGALIQMAGYGTSPAEAASLFAVLSNALADDEGARTATASIAVTKQLRDLLPGAGSTGARIKALWADPVLARIFMYGGRVPRGKRPPSAVDKLLLEPDSAVARQFREQLAAGADSLEALGEALRSGGDVSPTAASELDTQLRIFSPEGGSPEARIAALQADRKRAASFLRRRHGPPKPWPGASFEMKAGGTIEQLLFNPESIVAKDYARLLGELPDPEALAKEAETIVRDRMISPLEGTAVLKRMFETTGQQLLLKNIEDANASVVREGLEKILIAIGRSWWNRKAIMAGFEGSTMLGTLGPQEEVARILEGEVRNLRQSRYYVAGPGAMPSGPVAPTEQELATAQQLEELITTLNRWIDVQKELAAQAPRTPAALRQPTADDRE